MAGGRRIQKSSPLSPKCSVKWLHCAVFVLVSHYTLCLAFSGNDIAFYFVLYDQCIFLRDGCKQHLALIGS